MRRIKVTFDLGGNWRLVTTVQVSNAITVTAAKKAAYSAVCEKLKGENEPLWAVVCASREAITTEVIQ